MFLLLELLDYGVVGVQRELIGRGRGLGQGSVLVETLAHAAHHQHGHEEGEAGGEQHQRHLEEDRVGEELHNSLQYHSRKRLPKKKATMAMPPRKTPNGIS